MRYQQRIAQAVEVANRAYRGLITHPKVVAIAILAGLTWGGGSLLLTLKISHTLEVWLAYQNAQYHRTPWAPSPQTSPAGPSPRRRLDSQPNLEPENSPFSPLLPTADSQSSEALFPWWRSPLNLDNITDQGVWQGDSENSSVSQTFVPPPPAKSLGDLSSTFASSLSEDSAKSSHAESNIDHNLNSVRPEWLFPELFRVEFPSLGSPRLNTQIRLYTAYLAAFGPPDVLIVGSSRSLQGIDPATLQAELAQQGYPNVRVYNFSVNGATAQVVDVMVRQVLRPDQLPDLIIWGDGSRAFNSGRTDATYSQIIASEGYQRLQQGDRPIPYKAFASQSALLCRNLDDGSIHPSHTGISCDRLISEPSRLRRWERDRLVLQRRWVEQYGDGLNRLGFHVVTDVFNPSRYYQHYPRVPGAYDSNYVPFQLEGVQTTATIRLSQYLQRQNIPLVVVNLPLADEYLDAYRQQRELQFRRHMIQLAQQQGFVFRDLSQAGLSRNSNFADPSHLNINGARAVATYLAQDAALPWHTLSLALEPDGPYSRAPERESPLRQLPSS